MSILHGVLMFTVIFILVFIAGGMLEQSTKFRTVQALALGLGAGAIHGSAPAVPAWLAMIYLAIVLFFMVLMAIWWSYNGSSVKEMIVFILTDILLMWTGMAAADRILDLASSKWVIGLITALPKVALILSVGFFIYDRISFKEDLKNGKIDLEDYADYEDCEDENGCYVSLYKKLYEKIRRWVRDEEGSDDYNHCATGDYARNC